MSVLSRAPLLVLVFSLLAACTASPEYPTKKANLQQSPVSHRANYVQGQKMAPIEAPAPLTPPNRDAKDNGICVGEWCNCSSR